MKSFRWLLILFALTFISACQANNNETEAEKQVKPAKDGVFIHITHGVNDPHEVLMALMMAEMMAKTQDVLVYFDIDGVEAVLKDSKDITFSHFPSSHTQIKKLADMGVTIMACPGCLKVIDKTGDDLMDGVKVAEKETFFNFTEGRILTLDY